MSSFATPGNDATGIFSIDVEDWFHILQVRSAPPVEDWDSMPSRVEANFLRMLDLLETRNARVTCFFLGWVAERFPRLVREAIGRGHEIASHGYAHQLVFNQTSDEFLEDIRRARYVLENTSGHAVTGYRSPGFSATARTEWFFERLCEAGYEYDSSVFPARRAHGGMVNAVREPHVVETRAGTLIEFPVSVAEVLGRPLCFFGGGYLRLFPYSWILRAARTVIQEGRPVIFYVHPREIDPEHPRLPMPLHRRFKSYVNLHTTECKILNIISEFPLSTFREYIDRRGAVMLQPAGKPGGANREHQ